MLSLTHKDGHSSSLFRISWPVYQDYTILPLEEYLVFVEDKTRRTLSEDDKRLLKDKREKLGYTYAIFPTTTEIKHSYDPLKKLNTFIDLGKIISYNLDIASTPLRPQQNLPKVQANILRWISKYGLPYHSTQQISHTSSTTIDDVRRYANEIEVFLEERLGQYAMLQETFLALACEAHLVNRIFLSAQDTINKSLVYALLPIIDRERPMDIPTLEQRFSSRDEVFAHVRNELLSLLQKRMNGYSRQVTLSLDIASSNETGPKYLMKFDIPDLLTALWYQFYTLVTDTSKVSTCKECGQLFVPTRTNQKFCSPLGNTTISSCRSRRNKRLHDHPEMKENR